jgi:hypothetical protein
VLGVAGGSRAVVEDLVDLELAELIESWSGALPRALGEPMEVVASRR